MNRKKQKILQVITKSNFGGAQKYVYELSTELDKLNYEVTVALGGDGILKEKLEQAQIKTIKIDSLKKDIALRSDFKTFLELIEIIKKEKPDVLHLNSSKIGGLGVLAGRICSVPKIIFTIHGFAFNENRSFLSKIFIKTLYWLIVLMSHYSIAVSEQVKKQFLQIPFGFLLKNKIKIVKNAIRPIKLLSRDISRKFIEAETNQDLKNQKIIGTIAELHHIKGLNYLIEATKILTQIKPELTFVVFGEGEERQKLEKQIIENNLENKFFLLGFVEDASQYLKGLDLFILPSLSEGLALSILEAKQANIKIAASNVGGIPEATTDYPDSILFEPKNSLEIVEKVQQILNVKLQTKPDSKNEFEKDFSKMVEKTIELYQ